jgi:AraC-like DNA-binding protein
MVIAVYGCILFLALSTRQSDLVEARRRFRRWFVGALALTGLIISGVEISGLDGNLPGALYPIHAGVFLALTALFVLWSVQLVPEVSTTTAVGQKRPHLPDGDAAILHRIERSMAEGIWRQEGLIIADLARAVEAPEHRVRRVINQGLGFRNFAQFVNARRVAAAQDMLADPMRADMPVLSVAFEVGFASVGPFNRAFRDVTGQSPTEYRKAQLPVARQGVG